MQSAIRDVHRFCSHAYMDTPLPPSLPAFFTAGSWQYLPGYPCERLEW